jgi:hypothetical protein
MTTGEDALCGPGWIHAYEHPLLAVLHNPTHADFDDPLLWECETTDENPLRDGQMKIGVRNLTTIKKIPLPEVTNEQRIKYGILCALEVCSYEKFYVWAKKWLNGEDRTYQSAEDVTCFEARGSISAIAAAYAALGDIQASAIAAEKAAARKDIDLIGIAKKAIE